MTKRTVVCLMVLALGAAVRCSSAAGWHDTFYQYRIPLEVEVAEAGWQVLPLDGEQIVAAINELEDLSFDDRWFAYNHVLLVTADGEGRETGVALEGGFYLAPAGDNLAEGLLEGPLTPRTHGMMHARAPGDLEAGAFHLLRYISSNAGYSPMKGYDPIFPPGSPMRRNNYRSSYEPPLLPKARTLHERLFIPDEHPLDLHVSGTWAADIEELSVRRVALALLANLPAGRQRLTLYYQPMTGHHLAVPERRTARLPERTARLLNEPRAEKYYGATRYRVAAAEAADLWFAETTVKITPETPVPEAERERIVIRLAGGEAQTFQVVMAPRRASRFEQAAVGPLAGPGGTLPVPEIRLLDYVPINRPSFITPVAFTGRIGDPLVPVEARELSPEEGNLALVVTVSAHRDMPPGAYEGLLHVVFDGETVELPLTVEVLDFFLPEFSPFRSSVGATYIAKTGEPGEDPPFTLDFHGLSREIAESGDDLRRLARDYFRIMAKNRFHPKTPALYEEIGLKWDPPPQGYNVDAPGNYFRLYDWDFTRFNETLAYFIDELKVNQFALMHINPKVCNMFMHLPGEPLECFPRSTPFVTMGWQTFRDMTFVAYGKRQGDGYYDISIEITRDQFDQLLLDYFRAIAENLDKRGWLDKAHIFIDEGMDAARLHHFLSVLKSDPLVARIKVGICIQGFDVFDYKLPESDEYAFRGLLDFYMPEMAENYNRWETYLFPDYGIEPDREKLWNYAATGARFCIDTPGVNHRQLALDMFNRGASGYYIWASFGWYNWYDADRNPWRDPYARLGNGMFSYFYPPRRDGSLPEKPDFTITPSIRVTIHRQASQDYDYAWILENLVREGRARGTDVAAGELVLADVGRFFDSTVHWSQNDAWYLELRERMAEAITGLKSSMVR